MVVKIQSSWKRNIGKKKEVLILYQNFQIEQNCRSFGKDVDPNMGKKN